MRCLFLFLTICLFCFKSQAQNDSLRSEYHKKVKTRALIKAAVYGGIIGIPLGRFDKQRSNDIYAASAAISLLPVTQFMLRKTRENVAEKLGIPQEQARQWDDTYRGWKKKKKEEKRKSKNAKNDP